MKLRRPSPSTGRFEAADRFWSRFARCRSHALWSLDGPDPASVGAAAADRTRQMGE
jgi:hypothetical protein